MRRTRRTVVAAAALLCVCGTALAQGSHPQENEVNRILQVFGDTWWNNRPGPEELSSIASEAMKDLDLSTLSGVQLGRLLTYPTMLASSGRVVEVRQALNNFLDDRGADGAAAQVQSFRTRLWSSDEEEHANLLRSALKHPGLDEAMRAGAVHNLFARLAGPSPEVLKKCVDELFSLERFLTPEWASVLAFGYRDYYEMLSAAADGTRAEELERIRGTMVSLAKGAAEGHPGAEAAKFIRNSARFLDGPALRGTLIGNAAPEFTVAWSSDESIRSLASLKGRVVVVDFWATWCGPCIMSFPDVRELVSYYEGYPVTVLGITSLQGFHIDESRERTDTKGDPKREYALMAEYIPKQNITWPVVFSEEDVFNPDYGVRGIPHVAIIDPAGKVRYNGLHPGLPRDRNLADKSAKINALLKEAGLPTPPPVDEPAEKAASATPRSDQ